MQTQQDDNKQSYIVLYWVVLRGMFKFASCASFEGLTSFGYAYLSWKEKATYVDGVYSEGSGLQ